MFRTLLIAAGAAALGACSVPDPVSDSDQSYRSSYSPSGFVDRDGDNRDDRVYGPSAYDGPFYDIYGNYHTYRFPSYLRRIQQR